MDKAQQRIAALKQENEKLYEQADELFNIYGDGCANEDLDSFWTDAPEHIRKEHSNLWEQIEKNNAEIERLEQSSEQSDEPKAYCPHCGRAFERSDWGLNYDSGLIEYACPECDFTGTEYDVVDRDKIECDLMDDFDTVTQEDIQRVIDELESGEDYETALETVRNQIKESEEYYE